MIVCREVADVDPMLISLIENMARVPMHPADECIAFAKLLDKGQGVEGVAAAFAVEVKHVQQCVALARLHPDLLKAFRERKFGMDVAKAFTCEPNQARQLAVWKKLPSYQRSAHYVRDALTEQDFRAGDRLARFVGVDVYKGAGGEVRQDLFADDAGDGLILVDPGLVETLAAAKLADKSSALVGQGWAWGEVLEHAYSHDVGREAASRGFLRVDAKDADRSRAGYFVYCDQSGHQQIDGPYMPKKEAKAQERAKGGAVASEGVAAEARVPESLMQSLTAHKSAALQVALLQAPRVALALLAANVLSDYFNRTHLRVRCESQGSHIESMARGFEKTKPAQVLAAADAAWESRVPEGTDAFPWFLEQPQAVSIDAIVWSATRSFTIINGRKGTPEGAAEIQRALGFNLADHFKPTVETYLGLVPKAKILSDVAEALGAQAAAPMAGMKKGELAAAAEAKLAEVAWVPEAVR